MTDAPDSSDALSQRPTDSEAATRTTRAVLVLFAAVATAALMTETVQRAVSVPAAPPALAATATRVEILEALPEVRREEAPEPPRPEYREHTVEKSEVTIKPKFEPKPEPEPLPEPEPKPEPVPVPEPAPQPIEPPEVPEVKPEPETKPEPILEVKPEVKPEIKPKPEPKPPVAKPVRKPKPKPAPKPAKMPAPKKDAAPPPEAPVGEVDRAGAVSEAGTSSVGTSSSGTPAGAGGAPGGSAGSNASVSGESRDRAIARILAVIEAHKTYPRRARQTGAEGVVLLEVRLNASGVVEEVRVAKPHGSVLLNRAATSAAKPLAGLDTSYGKAACFEIPVEFRLD